MVPRIAQFQLPASRKLLRQRSWVGFHVFLLSALNGFQLQRLFLKKNASYTCSLNSQSPCYHIRIWPPHSAFIGLREICVLLNTFKPTMFLWSSSKYLIKSHQSVIQLAFPPPFSETEFRSALLTYPLSFINPICLFQQSRAIAIAARDASLREAAYFGLTFY